MGEEQDSWFKQAFGVDVGQAAEAVQEQVSAVVGLAQEQATEVVQQAEAAVAPVEAAVSQAVTEGQAMVAELAPRVVEIVQQAKAVVEPVLDEALDGAKAFGERVVDGVSEALNTPGLIVADFEPPAVPLDGDTPAPDTGAPPPDPTFVDLDRTFGVLADNPIEFIDKANQFMGQDAAAHMETGSLSVSAATLDAQGKVVTSGLVVTTTTRRPHWSGGRTIGDEKTVIEKAEELIRGHEERHRQIMKNGMASAATEMRGKPGAKADAILVKWIAKVEKEQNALDAREGKIVAVQGGGRITDVQLVPR